MGKSCSGFGEIPKRLKGLPWKGSRSLVAARGFKSLFLRFEIDSKKLRKNFEKSLKKVLTKKTTHDILNESLTEITDKRN